MRSTNLLILFRIRKNCLISGWSLLLYQVTKRAIRLKSGNVCYHSVQNLLFSCLLSKNVNIRIYKTMILPVVLYECKTWSPTLREKQTEGV
jgi:hypothetical protein